MIHLQHGQSGEGWCSGNREDRVTTPTVRRRVVFWGTDQIQLHHRQSVEVWCSGEQSRYTYTTDSKEKGGVLWSREDTVTTLILRRRVVFWGTY